MSISIKNQTKRHLPRIKFDEIKEKALGNSYELSLVFIGSAASRKLNRTHRGKDYSTNVLSFPLSKESGEIFIDLKTAEKEYKKFEMNFQKFIVFLFIHGLFHLKGMEHGDTMERAERNLLNVSTNRHWY